MVPLASSFMLSTKEGKKAWVETVIDSGARDGWRFDVRTGLLAKDHEGQLRLGTKAGKGQGFVCVLTGANIDRSYIQAEGKADRLGARLMAVVADGSRGRLYLSPTGEHEEAAANADAEPAATEARDTFLSPPTPTRAMITGGVCSAYGLRTWGHLFTSRQLVALTTFSDLIGDARAQLLLDARGINSLEDNRPLHEGGAGLEAYADAVATLLALSVGRAANRASSLCYMVFKIGVGKIEQVFRRQSLPMTWDFCRSKLAR